MNPDLLKSTWDDLVGRHGPEAVALRFYSTLFLGHPHLRPLFGVDMADQRRKLAATLGLVVRSAHDLDAVVPTLQRLGRAHRRFVATDHELDDAFDAVGGALLATLAHFAGDGWTDDVAQTWTDAYGVVAAVMLDAAREANQAGEPSHWDAPIVHIERRHDQAFIVIDPGPTFPADTVAASIALHGRPGDWLDVTVGTVHDGRRSITVRLDESNPVTLALLQARRGDIVRLGAPLEPLEDR